MYTYNYSQPDAYHFSLDSVVLAKIVAERMRPAKRVLDLCAGCGVVGFDLLFHRQGTVPFHRLEFLEVQEIYESHFAENALRVGRQQELPEYIWTRRNYASVIGDEAWKGRFDLIVSNPPYFDRGQGNLPPSDFKARCRFFLDADFAQLLEAIDWMLADRGEAFILLRESARVEEARRRLQSCKVTRLDPIRGTELIRVEKVPGTF